MNQWKRLGSFMFERRKALGKTAEQVAEEIGLSRVSICNFERGAQRLTVDRMNGYCLAYRVSPKKILSFFL